MTKNTLHLHQLPSSSDSLLLLMDGIIFDYTKFVHFLYKLDPNTRKIHLNDVFGSKQNFFFLGEASGVPSLRDNINNDYQNYDPFVIQYLGLKKCFLQRLPSIDNSNYKGFVISNCGVKGNFFISLNNHCGLETISNSYVFFESCGNDDFYAANLKGLAGVKKLHFRSCGYRKFHLTDTSFLSDVIELKFEFCGYEDFVVNGSGLKNLQTLIIYKSGLDKFVLHEPNNYGNVKYLSIQNCGTDNDGVIISNTKGFQNLRTFHMINCAVNSQLTITDVTFFSKLETLTISNCGAKGFVIDDLKTILPLDKVILLLNEINDAPNGIDSTQPGTIKIRTQFQTQLSTQEKQYQKLQEYKLNRAKNNLENKGWVIDIRI